MSKKFLLMTFIFASMLGQVSSASISAMALKNKLNDNKFLIVANGPFLSRATILELVEQRTVVALDGACNKLAKLGIKPQVILGDFDSVGAAEASMWGIKERFDEITEASQPYLGKYQVTIVPQKNQNATDLSKAIDFCDQLGATSIDIVCALGGRVDHTLSNLRALRVHYKKNRPMYLHAETQTMTFAHDEEVTIKGEIDDYCGIVSFPSAAFSSQGLRYNGDHYKLVFGFSDSTSNQLSAPNASVTVQGEALVIHPGYLKAQRDFAHLSYPEQLMLLYQEQQWVLDETTVAQASEKFSKP